MTFDESPFKSEHDIRKSLSDKKKLKDMKEMSNCKDTKNIKKKRKGDNLDIRKFLTNSNHHKKQKQLKSNKVNSF